MTKKSYRSVVTSLFLVLSLCLGCAESSSTEDPPLDYQPIQKEPSFLQIRSTWPSVLCTTSSMGKICHEHPKVGAVSLNDIAIVSSHFQWIVGEKGVIWHFDGQDFKLAYSEDGLTLTGVYALNENRAIAVGYTGDETDPDYGVILEWNGKRWQPYEGPCTTDPTKYCTWNELREQFAKTWLVSISGTSQGDFWIVGALPDDKKEPQIPLLLEKKGTGPLSRVTLPKWYGGLNAVHAIDKNDVWVVGNRGTILHSENSDWRYYDSGVTRDFYGVYGRIGSSVWIVGKHDPRAAEKSIILRFNGISFSKIIPAKAWDLRAVWGTSDSDMWFAGSFGTMIHFDGAMLSLVDLGEKFSINSMQGLPSTNELMAIGESGAVLGWDGNRFNSLTSESQERLLKMAHFPSGESWAVGRAGTVLKRGATDWAQSISKTAQQLTSIWGSGPGDLWVVGDKSTVLHGNGNVWTAMSTPLATNLYAVWGSPDKDVYIAGNDGIIFRGDTFGLWTAYQDKKTMFSSAWGSGSSDVWFGGDSGTLVHWDGIRFASQVVGPADSVIFDIFGTSADDVWLLSSAGQIFHKEGSAWKKIYEDTSAPLFSISGSSPSDIFVLQMGGNLLHYDGNSWQKFSLGNIALATSVLSIGPKEVLVSGAGGMILRISL